MLKYLLLKNTLNGNLIFDHIFVGREKERLGYNEAVRETDRWTHNDPSEEWTDGRTNRQTDKRKMLFI